MVDALQKIHDFITAQAGITALTGARVYAGRNVPPEGYKPSDGACITFKLRGGRGLAYENQLLSVSVQFKCYALTEILAEQLYIALVDAFNDAESATILHAELEVPGQQLEESETQWRFNFSFFTVLLRNG